MADNAQEDVTSPKADESTAQGSDEKKATLDTGKITAPDVRATQKVELDLEDAAFLDDDDEEEEESPQTSFGDLDATDDGEEEKKSFWTGKTIILLLLLAMLAGTAVYWFFLRPKPQQPPPPVKKETAAPAPKKEVPPELAEHHVAFEPFWVEFEVNGTCRFLTCRFSFPMRGDILRMEVEQKRLILRDAVYYYFKNKDLVFLGNKDNADKLKTDLLEIVNQYLGNGQLGEILIQEYRVE